MGGGVSGTIVTELSTMQTRGLGGVGGSTVGEEQSVCTQ